MHENGFVILNFSYQIGGLLGRSSFHLYRFPRVDILTIIQFLCFCILGSVAYFRWLAIGYQMGLMFTIGLVGGFSYVNCMYLVLEDKNLNKSQKELAINVCGFISEFTVTLAAIFGLIISNFVITNSDL